MSGPLFERHKALLKDEPVSHPFPKAKKISPRELVQSLKAINAPTHTNGKRPPSLKHGKHAQEDPVRDATDPDPPPGRGSTYRLADTMGWPFQCVGKVIVGSGPPGDLDGFLAAGTGVMVGPRVMLTASHIMPAGIGESVDPWWISFSPGLSRFGGGAAVGSSLVQQYHYLDDSVLDSGGPSGNDVVVCILELPLGDTCGWWGSESRGYAVDYEQPILPGATSVGYYQNQDQPSQTPTAPLDALTLVSRNVILNQVQIESEAVGDDQIFDAVSSLPAPDDTADFRNWRFRTNAYARDAWAGGPLWIDAAGIPLDPEADGRDASTDASISPYNPGEITSPRVIGVVGRNYMDQNPYTCHGGGVLMVFMIQHANQLFP